MEYRREIDGLRALAVLSVILFHAGFETFSGGFVGVDVFFVISGYLITSIILAEKQADTFSLSSFYERRARRILPALFVVIFACLPFAWMWLLPGDMKEFSDSIFAVSTFSSNILFWRTSGYFDTAAELKPLLHTWSLAVEEQYYVLFPVFLMLAWRLGKRWIVALLAVLFLISLAVAHWGALNKPLAAFFLLPTRAWELLIGAFIAFYFAKSNRIFSVSQSVSQSVSFVGLLLITYAVFWYDKQTPFPSLYALVPTVGAGLIILFATQKTFVGGLLGSKLLVGVGLISYSLYLWHQPLFSFAKHLNSNEPSKFLMTLLAGVAVVLAYVSWKFIESPFRNKCQFSRKQIIRYGVAGSAFFIFVGLLGNITNGFLFRFETNDRYLAAIQVSEAGKYVQKRFNELSMHPFDLNDNRLKVLIIGDSYGQDLVNALYESDFKNGLQISTRYISHSCGNLFVDRKFLLKNILESHLRLCEMEENKGLFEDEKLRQLMLSADEIWFVSAWLYWQTELIKNSVENVDSYSSKKVKVFGSKDFGKVAIKDLLAMSADKRILSRGIVYEGTIEINARLESELAGFAAASFIDIQKLMCGNDIKLCSLFTEGGDLISYDGGHLTKLGAKYCGEKLAQHNLLKSLVVAK